MVGRNLGIQEGVSIDPGVCWLIRIGDDVTLAPRVSLIAHDASTKRLLGKTRIGKIEIGSRVFVGAGSIILPGVTIGDDVVIGAGSVVARDIPSGVVAYGNPCRVVGAIDEFIGRKRTEMLTFPNFGEEFTERRNITAEHRKQMNREMKDRIGYLV